MSGHQLEVGLNWTTTFFNQQNKKPIFSITPDGRFIPGEGLSDDEVTQHFAEVMAGAFQSQIRYSVSKHMADEIERLREALREIGKKLSPEKYDNEVCLETYCGELARAALVGEGK